MATTEKKNRDRARCAAETAEQRSERLKKRLERDHARHALLKLLVEDKLLHSGKVPVNAEMRPLRRETRNGSFKIRHFDEDVME